MRTKIMAFVLTILLVSSCSKEKVQEDKVIDTFIEYVKTDFGNPKDFVEITKIEDRDTFSSQNTLARLSQMDSLEWAMTPKQQKQFVILKHVLGSDSIFIVQHHLKVRVRAEEKGEMEVKDYYVIERNGEYTVQEHALKTEEVPPAFTDALMLIGSVTETLKIIFGEY